MATSESKGQFFLQNESIRITNRIDSNRELECSSPYSCMRSELANETFFRCLHGHIGAVWVSWPPWKDGWKIKKRKHAKKRTVFCVYVIFWEQSGQAGVENGVMLTTSDILQNAPFRSQIFFAWGGKGALTPLTKILRTPLRAVPTACIAVCLRLVDICASWLTACLLVLTARVWRSVCL